MVATKKEPGVPIADAIEYLRAELESALLKGSAQQVRFSIPTVSVTLSVVASRGSDVNAKVRWWVVEAGGGAKWTREQTQTVELTLRPVQVDEHGDMRVGLWTAGAPDHSEAEGLKT